MVRATSPPPVIYRINSLYISTSATLGAGGSVVLPEGFILMGMIGTGASYPTSTLVEISTDGGTNWEAVEDINGDGYAGKTQTTWSMFRINIPSDGLSLRIRNSGGGNVTAFQYVYTKEDAV